MRRFNIEGLDKLYDGYYDEHDRRMSYEPKSNCYYYCYNGLDSECFSYYVYSDESDWFNFINLDKNTHTSLNNIDFLCLWRECEI